MTDMIFRDTVRDLAVVAANVNRLVVVPDERLVLLRVFGALRFGWPINLGMPALIGRSGVLLENPVLKSGLFEPEDVEKNRRADASTLRLCEDVGTILKGANHAQRAVLLQVLSDPRLHSLDAVRRARVVLPILRGMHGLSCEIGVFFSDAPKHGQDFFDVGFHDRLFSLRRGARRRVANVFGLGEVLKHEGGGTLG